MSTKRLQPSFEDRADFENAAKGLIALTEGKPITTADGRLVQHLGQYSFLHGECPSTAEPKLWRYGQLMAQQGLWEVVPGIYQLRGFDISNMTVVEGRNAIIVIDPLVSNETAVAALAHYRAHRNHGKPVKAMIFSHSHLDHFGGAQGIVDVESNPDIAIIAPEGFVEEAISENLIAGPAMRLRTTYMRGTSLAKCPTGQIGDGLGLMISGGTHSCLPPTITIDRTGQEVTIDEVQMVFQNVPGTEAPAEINVYFPDRKTLFVSECATHTMHNILPLPGTQVRDAKKWWQGLDETIQLHGNDSEVLLSGHHWPTWGSSNLTQHLSEQRDFSPIYTTKPSAWPTRA